MAREYKRVKDKSTGHKFSVIASTFDPEAMQELKQDAVDIYGNPLPPEFAATPSPSSQSGQKATTTKKES